jgi:hypothetical protein
MNRTATLAEDDVRTLWRVLALVCMPRSVHYEIVPGLTRKELLSGFNNIRPSSSHRDARGPALTAAEQLPAQPEAGEAAVVDNLGLRRGWSKLDRLRGMLQTSRR